MALRPVNGVEVGDYVPLPPLQGRGPCIVVGHAPGFEEEYKIAKSELGNVPVFAVNRAAYHVYCDFCVSVHPDVFFSGGERYITVSDRPLPHVDIAFPIATRGGSSALLATLIALVMGHSLVVTAGVHLVGAYKSFQGRWMWYADQISARVKSVSPKGTFITDFFGGLDNG